MMYIEELVALLVAELEDDVDGAVLREEGAIVLKFADGTTRTILVR